MWYQIIVIVTSLGQTTFVVNQLPSYSEEQCLAQLSRNLPVIEKRLASSDVDVAGVLSSCVKIPDGDDI